MEKGLKLIKRYVQLKQRINGPVSISETQMKLMIKEIRRIENILGSGDLGVRIAEEGIQIYRRYSNVV